MVDDRYLEDQIYASLSYQRLLNLPDEINQTGFSYSFSIGIIKDIPLNQTRNRGLALGLGYNLNTHYFKVDLNLDEEDILNQSNKVSLNMVELPIEIRFRNSTPEKYNFWRIYPGFKFAYAFYTSSNIKQSEDLDVFDVIEINNLQYGVTLSAGYNKWNLYGYYGISELFKNARTYSNQIGVTEIKLGLIFYLL